MSDAVLEVTENAVLEEAIRGLSATPKTLSPWLFYDEAGSRLFEAITELPEYYLTRTERGIFAERAAEVVEAMGGPVTIAELGAGSSSKTGILLRAFVEAQGEVLYQSIDISPTALEEAAELIASEIPGVTVAAQAANYITETYTIARPAGMKVLALYIGSSIGNFSPVEAVGILRALRERLEEGDALLLGVDLAPGGGKRVETLIAAYDDAAGVTAAFNRNVLVRLNRELGADFAVERFAHRARWNAAESRMEMHLESLCAQTVVIDGERIEFAAGETIHTENSCKFSEASLRGLMESAGFVMERVMGDEGGLFAVGLGRVVK